MAKTQRIYRDMPKTVNELIADRALRHAIFLERYKTSLVNDIIAILNRTIEPELVAQIEKGLRDITRTSPRLKSLFKDNGELVKAEYQAMETYLYKNLRDFSTAESKWQLAALKQSTPIALDFVAPAPKVLKALASNQLMQGALIKDWFARLSTDTAFKVNQQIQIGMIEGEGIDAIVRRIKGTKAANYTDGILNISRHHLQAVVRTSVSEVSHSVREESYKANDDVVKGVQIIATLDAKTCVVCAGYDGKVFEIGKGPRPPFHYGCRCSDAPALKSWKELGIDLAEAPEGTRASMNGQVPANITYGKWLKQQSKELQEEVLGKTKAELFRRGTVPIERFIDRRDRPLKLNELRSLEKKLTKAG